MVNVIVLSKNYRNYVSGYYHNDIVDAWCSEVNAFVYGPGYPNFSQDNTFENIVSLSPFEITDIDIVVMSTSWDEDHLTDKVDPCPSVDLSQHSSFKKVYYLNKEYKKFDLRIEYAKKQRVDVVLTVHPDCVKWNKIYSDLNFVQSHFAVNFSRFGDKQEVRKYDFGFTGSLHQTHLDFRAKVKSKLFKSQFMHLKSNKEWRAFGKKSPLQSEFRNTNIYWAEFGARGFWLNNLLPTGDDYAKFLCKFKSFLNTPSAVGIFNTRFFELMASNTLIVCPRVDEYCGVMQDQKNCLMYDPDMSDFQLVLDTALDAKIREPILQQAKEFVKGHTYHARVKTILKSLALERSN